MSNPKCMLCGMELKSHGPTCTAGGASSDTPETDAFARKLGKILANTDLNLIGKIGPIQSLIDECISKLERERDEARKQLPANGEWMMTIENNLAECQQECDQLRAVCDELAKQLVFAIEDINDGALHRPLTCGKLGKPLCSYHSALFNYQQLPHVKERNEKR